VLDRESTFADDTIVAMLKEHFIPVAIDQWYTRRQQDTEGEFYRKIASQGPRSDFSKTTQGLYIADPGGKLIAYNNNRGPERIRKLMEKALASYVAPVCEPLEEKETDKKYDSQPPEGAVVIRCGAKVLDGYEHTKDPWQQIFQRSVARDNLWVLKGEIESLQRGELPQPLIQRIARFHLVDNTRGQPPTWSFAEIRSIKVSLQGKKIVGNIHLETEDGSRGFIAALDGEIDFDNATLTKFELVATGPFWGTGQFTLEPPKGKFPLVVAFQLPSPRDKSDFIPPHGSRGWVDGYVFPDR
jgi:hypothetical protein